MFRDRWLSAILRVAVSVGLGCPFSVGVALAQVDPGTDTPVRDGQVWNRHTIDNASRGADGVKLADVNQDGRVDIVTGWEEGGQIRIALQPPRTKVKQLWPSVLVGQVKSPEDALAVDLNGGGTFEVISSCEGGTRAMFLHQSSGDVADAKTWSTQKIPVSGGKQWMFASPADINGTGSLDLFVAAKGSGAEVGWLEVPSNPADVDAWKYHPLQPCGWVMSLESLDLDADGDFDLLVSDRKGKRRGVYWLENPGREKVVTSPWKRHDIGGQDFEVMFLDAERVKRNANGNETKHWDIFCATRNEVILHFETTDLLTWRTTKIPNPFGVKHGKAVKLVDVNGDGKRDLVHTANTGGNRTGPGVAWLERTAAGSWQPQDISGPQGIKFDLLQTLDVDGDGDLDVITCEERDNLGVFWYENPASNLRPGK